MSRWVRCSYGKRAGFVGAKVVHFLESTNNSEDFFVEIRVKSICIESTSKCKMSAKLNIMFEKHLIWCEEI